MMKRALITEEFHPLLEQGLCDMGFQCHNDWDVDSENIWDLILDYEIIVINSKIRVTKELLDRSVKLKTIIRMGSGLEIIDLGACKSRSIKVISTPEGNANAVAEHVLGFILSSFNNLHRAQNEIYDGLWNREPNRGEELCGKTIAVIGCGKNGSRLVNLLQGFETDVLVYDTKDVRRSILNSRARQVENLDEIYQSADLLSLHIPLTDSTRRLVNSAFLSRFQKPLNLINTSRGAVLVWSDVLDALTKGILSRAMIDVYDAEPYQVDNIAKDLMDTGRLFLSPHIAGWTRESKKRMAKIAISRLKTVSI